MSTKAEQFRYQAERTKPKRAPRPPRGAKRRSTTDRGALNLSRHAGKKAPVTTEQSEGKRPSRKSTRRGSGQGKNSGVLEYLARVRNMNPETRHDQRGG
jgi:hypothetical protein